MKIKDINKNEIDISSLMDKIMQLYSEYTKMYNVKPKYLKLPIWRVCLLRSQADCLVSYKDDKIIPMYMGLIVCETTSITEIDDIEVF